MSKTFKQLNIGRDKPTFIIAEAGINHNGDLDTALRLVEAAKTAGASAIKFQTYVTEKRVASDSPIFGILKQCELSPDLQRKIKERADRLGILFFSTPFDPESVKFLEEIKVPLMKIASFDIVNKKLLDAVARVGIPTIISRGMADKSEIDTAIQIFGKARTEFAVL
ncbi:MAG: N-acetylneuraminate synthase family protein, partial [bacterium]|nr:N-acetylneuraminate synthase family protein [bacterium]